MSLTPRFLMASLINIPNIDRIDSLRSEVSEVSDGGQLLEDALEESFNQLEDNKKLVFRYIVQFTHHNIIFSFIHIYFKLLVAKLLHIYVNLSVSPSITLWEKCDFLSYY